jgi:hypothetical protein
VIAAGGSAAGLILGVLISAALGAALLVYARRRGRFALGVGGLAATFVLGTLFGVVAGAAVALLFAFAIRRSGRVRSAE